MRIQRHMSIAVPLPPGLPPSFVVAYLQTVHPIIRNLGTLSRFEETSTADADASNDPFFGAAAAAAAVAGGDVGNGGWPTTQSPVARYQIFEIITLAPGLSKEVTYPAYFQRVGEGVRVRANGAAGITGWCEFTVRARQQYVDSPSADGSISTPSTTGSVGGGLGGLGINGNGVVEEYELFESLVVEANALLMPFVCQTMQVAHRGLCDKVLQEAIDSLSHPQG